jgi:hypothetical protein
MRPRLVVVAVLARRVAITLAPVPPGLAVLGWCHPSADQRRPMAVVAAAGISRALAQVRVVLVVEQPVETERLAEVARQTQAVVVVAVTPTASQEAPVLLVWSFSAGMHRRPSRRCPLA